MVTPDAHRYMAMSRRRVCRPFHLRWLLPIVLGADQQRWLWVTRCSIVAVGILVAVYAGSVWMASVVFFAGVTFNWHKPISPDMTGMALALVAALLMSTSWWPLALVVVCVAGMVRETTPIFAALYAWNPVLLVGLIPVAIRWCQRPGPDVLSGQDARFVAHPLEAGQTFHQGRWRDPRLLVANWGGLLLGLAAMSPQLATTLALAYAQLLVATDSARLYVWALPVMAAATVDALPASWLPLIALTVVFNPWRTDGV